MIGMGHYSAAGAITEMDKIRKERLAKQNKAKKGGKSPSSSAPKTVAIAADDDNHYMKMAGYATKDDKLIQSERSRSLRLADDSTSFTTASTIITTGSTQWLETKLEKSKEKALQAIHDAMDVASLSRQAVRNNLVNAGDVAIALYDSKNDRGALLSLKKYQPLQAEYERLTVVLQKLQELHDDVSLGDGDDPTDRKMEETQKHLEFVEGHAKQMQSILDTPSVYAPATEAALLHGVASGHVQAFLSSLV